MRFLINISGFIFFELSDMLEDEQTSLQHILEMQEQRGFYLVRDHMATTSGQNLEEKST